MFRPLVLYFVFVLSFAHDVVSIPASQAKPGQSISLASNQTSIFLDTLTRNAKYVVLTSTLLSPSTHQATLSVYV